MVYVLNTPPVVLFNVTVSFRHANFEKLPQAYVLTLVEWYYRSLLQYNNY